jgi:hypothetical protein
LKNNFVDIDQKKQLEQSSLSLTNIKKEVDASLKRLDQLNKEKGKTTPQDFRELKQFNLRKDGQSVGVNINYNDYNLEKTFGIPSLSYYQKSLEALVSQHPNSKIWVFSDEKNEAEKVFPSEFRSIARWISDDQFSSAETLEIMRLGVSYVIANSTFSWWAAILSRTENQKVICPEPWFKLAPEPLGLVPPNWNRAQAW